MISRRAFIKAGGLALYGIGIGGIPTFAARAAASQQKLKLYGKKKTLVCIFQRGAMDGLAAVTPFTDENLKIARPDLFMSPAKDSSAGALIDLDGRFGLHPAMAAFETLFREKRLAIVHGMGSPNTTRSHFSAQDYMEDGNPFERYPGSGWLNRAVGLMGHDATPFRAVSLTASLPRSFYGDQPALAINDLKNFGIQMKGNPEAMMVARSFEDLYDRTSSSLLKETSKESFEAIRMLQKTNLNNYVPANNAKYPPGTLGPALKQIAQLIKMDVGLEVAFAELGGWDTHINQGTSNGVFAITAAQFTSSINAFWTDLGERQDEVTIMTMTEFGRTVKQNGGRGTDHGRASCSFILGNNVKGGTVYGNIDPLAIENLEDGRDLKVTTDFRSVFSEVADVHLSLKNDAELFPDWKGEKLSMMQNG